MASAAGCIVVASCTDVIEDRHWLTDTYILFATPYFAYDIYAMFLCYWHKLQVKGHEEEEEGGVRPMVVAVMGYLRQELFMVLHHIFMVVFCFPASLLWRQGKGDYFQGILFLAELSTPSVSLGKVLIQINLNMQVLLPYTYGIWRYASIPMYVVPLVAPWQCNLGTALLWPLQLYWFTLICRGALRLFARCSNSALKTLKTDNDGCLTLSDSITTRQTDRQTDAEAGGEELNRKTNKQSDL
uniref:TLC domain-containing protein n=1 Tax=Monopterus albus TaxID=43700 RepID=A0A3Q3PYU8_MONAL